MNVNNIVDAHEYQSFERANTDSDNSTITCTKIELHYTFGLELTHLISGNCIHMYSEIQSN